MTTRRQPNANDRLLPGSLSAIDAEMQRIISDPATSHWLRDALQNCLRRDALDAFNDATTLRDIVELRLKALFVAAGHPPYEPM